MKNVFKMANVVVVLSNGTKSGKVEVADLEMTFEGTAEEVMAYTSAVMAEVAQAAAQDVAAPAQAANKKK